VVEFGSLFLLTLRFLLWGVKFGLYHIEHKKQLVGLSERVLATVEILGITRYHKAYLGDREWLTFSSI